MEDELKLYRDVASISGEIVFKYIFSDDCLHVYGGHSGMSKYGTVINDFLKGMRNGESNFFLDAMSNKLLNVIESGCPEFFEEEIKISIKPGELSWYKAIGRKEYNDNWEEIGIIGKLIPIDNTAETENEYYENAKSSVEFEEGALDDIYEATEYKAAAIEHEGKTFMDSSLVEEALDTLSNTGNIGVSISTLLQNIGEKYMVDCITVQEYDTHTDVSSPCLQWYRPDDYELCAKNARLPFDNFNVSEWEEPDFVVIDKMDEYAGNNAVIIKMRDIGVKSLILCKYKDKGNDAGWISYERHNAQHTWTTEEQIAFRLSTKFITAYMLNMKTYLELVNKEEKEKTHDAITGLPKYEIFEQKAVKYINRPEVNKMAILCFGLNDLEKVNKIYGRTAGDELLKSFAEACKKMEDRFIVGCRMNAESFVVLVNQFDTRGNKLSAAIIDRINMGFEQECKEKYPEANVAVNTGIIFVPDSVEHLDNYITKARRAKDNAREEGISCVFAY